MSDYQEFPHIFFSFLLSHAVMKGKVSAVHTYSTCICPALNPFPSRLHISESIYLWELLQVPKSQI